MALRRMTSLFFRKKDRHTDSSPTVPRPLPVSDTDAPPASPGNDTTAVVVVAAVEDDSTSTDAGSSRTEKTAPPKRTVSLRNTRGELGERRRRRPKRCQSVILEAPTVKQPELKKTAHEAPEISGSAVTSSRKKKKGSRSGSLTARPGLTSSSSSSTSFISPSPSPSLSPPSTPVAPSSSSSSLVAADVSSAPPSSSSSVASSTKKSSARSSPASSSSSPSLPMKRPSKKSGRRSRSAAVGPSALGRAMVSSSHVTTDDDTDSANNSDTGGSRAQQASGLRATAPAAVLGAAAFRKSQQQLVGLLFSSSGPVYLAAVSQVVQRKHYVFWVSSLLELYSKNTPFIWYLIRLLLRRECETLQTDIEAVNTIFRSTTLFTTLLALASEQFAHSYMLGTVAFYVGSLVLDHHQLAGPDLYAKYFESLFLPSLFKALPKLPPELRAVYALLYREVRARLPGSEQNAVAGMFFLRLVCPSLLTPSERRMWNSPLTPAVKSALMLSSKTLQSKSITLIADSNKTAASSTPADSSADETSTSAAPKLTEPPPTTLSPDSARACCSEPASSEPSSLKSVEEFADDMTPDSISDLTADGASSRPAQPQSKDPVGRQLQQFLNELTDFDVSDDVPEPVAKDVSEVLALSQYQEFCSLVSEYSLLVRPWIDKHPDSVLAAQLKPDLLDVFDDLLNAHPVR